MVKESAQPTQSTQCEDLTCTKPATFHVERISRLQQKTLYQRQQTQLRRRSKEEILSSLAAHRATEAPTPSIDGANLCDEHTHNLLTKLNRSRALTYKCVSITQ